MELYKKNEDGTFVKDSGSAMYADKEGKSGITYYYKDLNGNYIEFYGFSFPKEAKIDNGERIWNYYKESDDKVRVVNTYDGKKWEITRDNYVTRNKKEYRNF